MLAVLIRRGIVIDLLRFNKEADVVIMHRLVSGKWCMHESMCIWKCNLMRCYHL